MQTGKGMRVVVASSSLLGERKRADTGLWKVNTATDPEISPYRSREEGEA